MKKNNLYILLGILLLASFLRLWNLSSGDPLSDEVLYSFRAIGPMDFDEAAEQTTPLEWFDPYIPSWTSLSFHDHPPLVFWIQHLFMNIFGETRVGFRLPSALMGIASVYLVYLLGKRLYSNPAGLIASGLLAVNAYHVTISRLGLQESYAIFFILLSSYLFLLSLKNDRYLIWTGTALGLAFLTKYTAFILIPTFLAYLLIFKREYFSNKKLWLGAGVSILLFSPVLIYNYKLYQAVGHFDFQFSYLVGQNPEVWKISPGKEQFPTFSSRLTSFLPYLIWFMPWVFLALAISSWAYFIFSLKNNWNILKTNFFPGLHIFWISLFIILVIGPSLRFLSLLLPFLALLAGAFLYEIHARYPQFKKPFLIALGLIVAWETFYTINSQLLAYPVGKVYWAYSDTRAENYNWGFNQLEDFLTKELRGKMPAFAFESRYHFIEEIQKKSLDTALKEKRTRYPVLILYDKNISSIPQLWILDRLQIYHAWPVVPVETYAKFLNEKGADYFKRVGIEKIYLIIPTENVPQKKEHLKTTMGASFEAELVRRSIEPIRILNKRGGEVFRIYSTPVE